nr:hypothetical protein [Tanacetum cinerariifolium]
MWKRIRDGSGGSLPRPEHYNGDGIHVDRSKIEAVNNWKAFKSPIEVQSFLGDEQDRAFQTLKDKLCNAPVLALPDRRKDFMIQQFSNYDCEIRYYPGKVNVIADALSRKERIKPRSVRAINMAIQSSIKSMILAAQNEASEVPLTGNVRTLIMDEAHQSRYFVYSGANKMYYDLKDMYWCPRMKKDIAL